jgi:hypothetical protein
LRRDVAGVAERDERARPRLSQIFAAAGNRRVGRRSGVIRRKGQAPEMPNMQSGAFEFVFHHENAHEGRRSSSRRDSGTNIDRPPPLALMY